jgi:hypothetical protein
MSASSWIDPRIDRVRVADVQAYLEDRGWRLQPFPRPELLVFGGPLDDDGEPILQVLPSSESLRDYRMRLEDLIGALGIIEERPASDVLTDILAARATNGAPRQFPPDGAEASTSETRPA